MTQTATLVRVNGRLMAQTVRSEACAQCRACAHGQTERQLIELPEDFEGAEGETVELTIPEGSVGKASLLGYGVPFIAFCLGLALGGWISSLAAWPQDLCCAAGALLLCAASLPLVRRAGRAMKTCDQLKVSVRRLER